MKKIKQGNILMGSEEQTRIVSDGLCLGGQ